MSLRNWVVSKVEEAKEKRETSLFLRKSLTNEDLTSMTSTEIEQLDLSLNQLICVPSNFLRAFLSLTFLSLSYNRLEYIPYNVFPSLSVLQYLELSSNFIGPSVDMHVDRVFPSSLIELDLSNNLLMRFDLYRVLNDCSNLQKLSLANNRLCSLDSSSRLQHGSNLRVLNLSSNSLIQIPPLSTCTQLLHLDISINRLLQLPAWIFSCEYLTKLHLEVNNLRGHFHPTDPLSLISFDEDSWKRLRYLQECFLNGNPYLSVNPLDGVKMERSYEIPNKISNYLYHGSSETTLNRHLLKELGISSVVCLYNPYHRPPFVNM